MHEYTETLSDRVVARYLLSESALSIQKPAGGAQTIALAGVARVRLNAYGDMASCELFTRAGTRHVVSLFVLDRDRESAKIVAYRRFVSRLHALLASAAPSAEFRAGGWLRMSLLVAGCVAAVAFGAWAARPILMILSALAIPLVVWIQRPRRYSPQAIPRTSLP